MHIRRFGQLAVFVSAVFCVILLATGVPAQTVDTSFLVTPEWVAQHNTDVNVRILDVRPDPHDYFAGHVPNAVHIADATLRGPLYGVPVQYQDPEILAKLLSRAGVKNTDRVVVYSDGPNVLGATMVAYVLHRMGHPKVMVMDGGWTAYKASQSVTQAYPRYTEAKFKPREDKTLRVTLDEVKILKDRKTVKFIDARPEKAYRGEISTWMRNGHIPGAFNIDWHTLMDSNNPHQFKSIDAIKAIMAEKGIGSTDDIVLYCGTSREASLEFMTLKYILGFPKVRLYEGSWTEYSSIAELPIETGARQEVALK